MGSTLLFMSGSVNDIGRDPILRNCEIPRQEGKAMVDISGRLQSQGRIAQRLNLDCALRRGAFVRQWAVQW